MKRSFDRLLSKCGAISKRLESRLIFPRSMQFREEREEKSILTCVHVCVYHEGDKKKGAKFRGARDRRISNLTGNTIRKKAVERFVNRG